MTEAKVDGQVGQTRGVAAGEQHSHVGPLRSDALQETVLDNEQHLP